MPDSKRRIETGIEYAESRMEQDECQARKCLLQEPMPECELTE